MRTKNLGDLMKEKGLVSEMDYSAIEENKSYHAAYFAKGTLALGLIDDEDLASFLADETQIARAPRNLLAQVDKDILKLIDLELLRRFEAIPVKLEGKKLYMAMADPLDRAIIRQLEFFSDYVIVPMVASLRQIHNTLSRMIKDFRPICTPFEEFLNKHMGTGEDQPENNSPQESQYAPPSNPEDPDEPRASAPLELRSDDLDDVTVEGTTPVISFDTARSDEHEFEDLSLDDDSDEQLLATEGEGDLRAMEDKIGNLRELDGDQEITLDKNIGDVSPDSEEEPAIDLGGAPAGEGPVIEDLGLAEKDDIAKPNFEPSVSDLDGASAARADAEEILEDDPIPVEEEMTQSPAESEGINVYAELGGETEEQTFEKEAETESEPQSQTPQTTETKRTFDPMISRLNAAVFQLHSIKGERELLEFAHKKLGDLYSQVLILKKTTRFESLGGWSETGIIDAQGESAESEAYGKYFETSPSEEISSLGPDAGEAYSHVCRLNPISDAAHLILLKDTSADVSSIQKNKAVLLFLKALSRRF